ncbi:MAG: tetratricopeptide repeat protein [Vampirovibrionales bacterium]
MMMSLCQRVVFSDAIQQTLAPIEAFIQAEAYDEARQQLLGLLESSPTEPAYLATLGRLLLDHSHNPAQATELLELALTEAPHEASIQLDAARANLASKQPAKALTLLSRLMEAQYRPEVVAPLLATLLESQGYIAEAASTYLAWQSATTETLSPVLALVALYQRHDAPQQALETLQTALEATPDDAQLWFLKGACLQTLEQEAESQQAFQQALQLANNAPEIHWQLAQWYRQGHKHSQALQHLVAFLEHTPNDVSALEALASSLHAMHRPHDAINVVQRLLSLTPNHAQAWLLLGSLASSVGEVAQAREAFEQAQNALEAQGQRADGLALRRVLTLPSVLASTHEAHTLLDQTLISLKALALHPPVVANPLSELAEAPYLLPFLNPENDLPWMKTLQQIVAASLKDVYSTNTPPPQPSTAKKRIGLVSGYWQAGHPTAWLLQPLLAGLNREVFDITWVSLNHPFEATAGFTLPPEDTVVTLPMEHWSEVQAFFATQAFEAVLIPDAGQDPHLLPLLHLPTLAKQMIQLPVLWPSTLGLPAQVGHQQHHVLAWPTQTLTPNELDQQFSETVTPAPQLPIAPLRLMGERRQRYREDFGLRSDDVFLYLPAALHKWHPSLDVPLMNLLEALPELQLFVHEAPHTAWTERLQHRWQQALQNTHPQSDALKRVHWLPQLDTANTLALFKLADVVLDTAPVGDVANVLKALSYGTPVLTTRGSTYKQQVVASLLSQLGEIGCQGIASSPDAWVACLKTLLAPVLAVKSTTEHATESAEKVKARQQVRQQWLEATQVIFRGAEHQTAKHALHAWLSDLLFV